MATTGKTQIPFVKKNYIIMLIGAGLIGLGYFLLTREKFIDANNFSIALDICPVIILAGLVVVGYGIMYKPGPSATNEQKA